MAIYLVAAVICSVIGYFMGQKKNRAVEGAVWGFMLGLVGLLILSLRKPALPKQSDNLASHGSAGSEGATPSPNTGRENEDVLTVSQD